MAIRAQTVTLEIIMFRVQNFILAGPEIGLRSF